MDAGKDQKAFTFSRFVTRGAMVLERLLPLALPAFAVVALFFIALWAGLFRLVPLVYHYPILGLFGFAFVVALFPLKHFRWPSNASVTARLESHNQLEHAPLRTQTDRIATGNSRLEQALWQEHQKRMALKVGALEGGRPNAGIAPKKRYVVFASLAGAMLIAFAFSSAPQGGKWRDILSPPPIIAAVKPRLDLWITPPDYTGQAPLFVKAGTETGVLTVPAGSIATLRVSRAKDADGEALQNIEFTFNENQKTPITIEATEPDLFQWTFSTSGLLDVALDGQSLRNVAVNVLEDQPPSIAWNGKININRNGSFDLKFITEDDYGIREGHGALAFTEPNEDANPLYDLPEITLRIRASKGRNEGKTRIALGDHPYAGIPMTVHLAVRDAAAQEARSKPRPFTLPQRTFTQPVAKSLIEQRRLIARNSHDAIRVMRLMEAMMLHPEVVIDNSSAFLGIRTAYQRIRAARSDDDLRDIVDYLWEIAINIEQGQLSDAEKRLQEARDNLRDAIENGASEEEIAQRTQELRDALNEYLEELARQSQQNGQNPQQAQTQQDGQEIRAQDLQKMLDQIEDLAQQGAKDQAEQLLSQMEQILDNLQAGRHQQEQGDNQQSQMQQRMNELGEIMRDQQQLMDQTFQQQQQNQRSEGDEPQPGQGQQDPNQPGQQPQGQQGQNQQGQPNQPSADQGQAMQRLQDGQKSLSQRLQEFTESLQGMGIDPGNEFGEAQGSMGDAGDSLGQGDAESATGQQAQALQALRDGAGQMMQQMEQAMEGERGGSNPQQAQQDRQGGSDPLGRPQKSNSPQFDSDVYVPDEIDMQRAREILNAIRKRLGDDAAPNSEKDYLERLLEFD